MSALINISHSEMFQGLVLGAGKKPRLSDRAGLRGFVVANLIGWCRKRMLSVPMSEELDFRTGHEPSRRPCWTGQPPTH
jgi:hypothetical protein